jgi:ABC-type phosphate/phosphonate transport system substrate-binding protein
MKSTILMLCAAAAAVILAGCQTTKAVSAKQSMIRAESSWTGD